MVNGLNRAGSKGSRVSTKTMEWNIIMDVSNSCGKEWRGLEGAPADANSLEVWRDSETLCGG